MTPVLSEFYLIPAIPLLRQTDRNFGAIFERGPNEENQIAAADDVYELQSTNIADEIGTNVVFQEPTGGRSIEKWYRPLNIPRAV